MQRHVGARWRVYEWLPPERPLSEDDRARAAAYLAQQARFDLAVWVGYRFRPGGAVDHELKLRLRGRRPGRRDLSALFWGVCHEIGVDAYIGIPTRAEMEAIRRVGDCVWERTGPAPEYADPLDFSSTSEPIKLPSALLEAIRDAMKAFPVVRRVGVSQSKLWKSGAIFKDGINFGVECDGPTAGLGKGPVGTISDLLSSPLSAHLRELMSGPRTGFGVTLGKYPDHSRPQIVYERVDAG
jgi:hypothetical protein